MNPHFNTMLGRNSMGTSTRLSRGMLRHLLERRLTCAWWLTAITQGTNQCNVWYSWTYRNSQQLNYMFLAFNLLPWRMELRPYRALDTSFAWMMGVPISGQTNVYGDNMSVIHNTQQPEPTLKKKNLSIFYHAVCKAVAIGEILMSHVQTETIFLTSWRRWPTVRSNATWWALYCLTFMMTIQI